MENIVGVKLKRPHVKLEVIKSLYQANETILLDEQFCYMSFYPILKILKEYIQVKQ